MHELSSFGSHATQKKENHNSHLACEFSVQKKTKKQMDLLGLWLCSAQQQSEKKRKENLGLGDMRPKQKNRVSVTSALVL